MRMYRDAALVKAVNKSRGSCLSAPAPCTHPHPPASTSSPTPSVSQVTINVASRTFHWCSRGGDVGSTAEMARPPLRSRPFLRESRSQGAAASSVCVCVCVRARARACDACMHVCVCISIYIYIYIYIYACIYIHACMHTYVHPSIHTQIYARMHTMHPPIHTYICTYSQFLAPGPGSNQPGASASPSPVAPLVAVLHTRVNTHIVNDMLLVCDTA